MANNKQKSQAEKVVNAQKHKDKKTGSKNNQTTKNTQEKSKGATPAKLPIRFVTSAIFLVLFVLCLAIFLYPDGVVLNLIGNLVYGLIGKVGFVLLIPVLLYEFIIHAFSGNRPVTMRTVCLFVFLVCVGCISHLAIDNTSLPSGTALLPELFTGGIAGTTGGFVCGGIAMILRWLLGTFISYLLLIVAALLFLLAGMQITIPSIIRAIQNRPRPDWEDEVEEQQEPAAVVVNHLTNKYIEREEQRRQRSVKDQSSKPAKPPYDIEKNNTIHKESNADAIIRQIESDVSEPVVASGSYQPADTTPKKEYQIPNENIIFSEPTEMPPLERSEPISVEAVTAIAADVKKERVTQKDAEESAVEIAIEIAQAEETPSQEYCFPPIDLLKKTAGDAADGTAEMRENSARLNETLASFKIEAHIINVTRGPSVTRYEVELAKGVRLSKLTSAADDIALSLGSTGVRIAAIPGKISVVGIEVPNRAVTTVSLRDVIDSPEFSRAKSKSSFAVGKDIGGSCIVGNIAKLPHMLIAGTTGSGKSVCMNSIIISLLYKASPQDVKLIMVDPKMVELGIYNGIPHLLIPVVTDPKKAAGSLQWAVSEMLRRYKAMSDVGVRDLESYNSIIESQEVEGAKLPQVVVIIDELADLMLVAAKEVEESICRIAQMGRAAGIHLIIATQRPSADVITGLMKANIPSRIAFAVASAMESRIILDTQGAEKLVGKGDMLYAPIGNGKPKRVQGCFVSDPEVEAVASYVKSNFTTTYDQQVMEEIEKKASQTGTKATAADTEPTADELAGDEMLPAAVDVILETGQASVSMLQRRLKLGYARAARIVDEMETLGIVGPFVGSKPRAILVTKEQWAAMRDGQPVQAVMDEFSEPGDSEPITDEI